MAFLHIAWMNAFKQTKDLKAEKRWKTSATIYKKTFIHIYSVLNIYRKTTQKTIAIGVFTTLPRFEILILFPWKKEMIKRRQFGVEEKKRLKGI